MYRIFLSAHDFLHVIIPKFTIKIHHFSHKGSVRSNQHIGLMDDFEKHIQTLIPILIPSFPFESLSIEPHIPIGQILQKVKQLGHNCIQPVFLHLHFNLQDQILATSQNPLIHEISHILLFLVFEREICLDFVSLDILDQESVGVVPGEEDISDDGSDSVFLEIQGFRPHEGTVG